jgi:hypothetical protein
MVKTIRLRFTRKVGALLAKVNEKRTKAENDRIQFVTTILRDQRENLPMGNQRKREKMFRPPPIGMRRGPFRSSLSPIGRSRLMSPLIA